ncbi:MAG: hypothetical protein ACI4NW_09075 [Stenotrophomonas sp.]
MAVRDSATAASSPSATGLPGDPPGIGEAFETLGQAGRESLDSGRDMGRAMRRLVAAEVAQARIVLARAAVWLAVAVAFGASAWLLLMAALIAGLHALGLSWLAATSISALVSLLVAAIGGWQALRYFEMARFEASRKQLAHLSRREREDEEDDVRKPNLAQVQRRIERASQVMDGRRSQLRDNMQQVRSTWSAAWTPWRILGAGVGLGFVSGKLDPEKAAAGVASRFASAPKILQVLTALSGLLAATKAQVAAAQAEFAADEAEAEQHGTDGADSTPGHAGMAATTAAAAGVSRTVDTPRQPPAAEAATGLGEDDPRY